MSTNSCVASCCMYCRVASSASGTSVSWPAAAVAHSFRFVKSCFRPVYPRRRRHRLTPIRQASRFRSGPVRCAAALWLWSSDLPPFRSGSAPHRKSRLPDMQKLIHCRSSNASASGRYSYVSAIAIMRRGSFLTVSPCVFRTVPCLLNSTGHTSESVSTATHKPPRIRATLAPPTTTDSKRIAASCLTGRGFLHRAVSKPPRPRLCSAPSDLFKWPRCFRYGPRHYRNVTLYQFAGARPNRGTGRIGPSEIAILDQTAFTHQHFFF